MMTLSPSLGLPSGRKPVQVAGSLQGRALLGGPFTAVGSSGGSQFSKKQVNARSLTIMSTVPVLGSCSSGTALTENQMYL